MAENARAEFVDALAGALPLPARDGPNLIVGIDGVDGAGKTRLADELAVRLASSVTVVRVSIDGFHRQRADRYRRGRSSAEGFWLDSYDYTAFREAVIVPFTAGEGTFLPAVHDVETDEILTGPRLETPRGSVLLVDGIFLHRRELRDVWDYSIFLDVPFEESVRRMSLRDGSPAHPESEPNQRYVGGQRIYLAECDPAARANLHIDYADLARPVIMRSGNARAPRLLD